MSQKTIQWFRGEVKKLPSVKACHPVHDSDADLMIRTWVGMNVKVYFLNGVPNIRALKRVIQENTRQYQGTMFLALHTLMPADKHRLIPDEWMQALHELNSERIYTFIPDEECIRQVHFDYMPDGIEREAWHGAPVVFEKLRVLNVSANGRNIRGQWMMADFGPNMYWKLSEQRAERLRGRFKPRFASHAEQFVWTHYDAGGMPGGATNESLRRAHMTEIEYSHFVLGIPQTASQEEVKAAYRKLAREYHPDVSQLPKDDAETRFNEITTAYEKIKTLRRWS